MKNYFHQFASYSALILVSSLPLPFDILAEKEKKPETVSSITPSDKESAIPQMHYTFPEQDS